MGAMTNAELLERLEAYYDEAPRALARVEEHGPLTLFVATDPEGWPYYARPRLGLRDAVTASEVEAVRWRQRELGVPEALEWVHETTPSLRAAGAETGLAIEECPLLVLEGVPRARAGSAAVRLMDPDDPDLVRVRGAIEAGFDHEGTATGDAGIEARDEWVANQQGRATPSAALVRSGLSVLFGAFEPDVGAVGGGSHNPRNVGSAGITEIVGVAALPAYRRRGIAAQLSAELARHALDSGVTTVFCSAAGDDVARIYESVGFRRVGTACIAEAG
jgi:ribosomal protein S18 acetylase RimI-like enzyme